MKLISNRGNLEGKTDDENTMEYVVNAIASGFECKIDVWHFSGSWYLGIDEPKEKISIATLNNKKFWIQAKNFDALINLTNFKQLKYFYFEDNDISVISNGMIWTLNNSNLNENCITYLPETQMQIEDFFTMNVGGICSNNIQTLEKNSPMILNDMLHTNIITKTKYKKLINIFQK